VVVSVDADNEEDAQSVAVEKCNRMSDEDFIDELDPQVSETQFVMNTTTEAEMLDDITNWFHRLSPMELIKEYNKRFGIKYTFDNGEWGNNEQTNRPI